MKALPAHQHQQRCGGQRRGVAENADVPCIAQLEGLVPQVEGAPQRAQAQHGQQHGIARLQRDRRLQQHVAQQGQQARHQTEQPDGRGGEGRHAPGQQRIAGPDERRRQRRQVAPGQRTAERAPPRDGNRCAAKSQHSRQHMRPAQRHARQQHGSQHHDEQRPQVVDQVGLHRRRMAQGDEQQEVVGKQPIHPQRQCAQWNAPLARIAQHQWPGRHTADQQRNAGEQKGRHMGE